MKLAQKYFNTRMRDREPLYDNLMRVYQYESPAIGSFPTALASLAQLTVPSFDYVVLCSNQSSEMTW